MNGGLVYISSIILLKIILYFIGLLFIVNILCLYILNFIKATKKFINLYFIIGEFIGVFATCAFGFYIYTLIQNPFLEFEELVFSLVFIIFVSFILMVSNAFFLLIRYRVFKYGLNYKNTLNEKREIKIWIIKSIIAGMLLSSFLTCLCMSIFIYVLW